MKYRYRNRKTGEVVTTSNRVNGKNWEPIEGNAVVTSEDNFEDDPVTEKEPKEAPVKKSAAKSAQKDKK